MGSGTSPVPDNIIETKHVKIDGKPKYCTRAPPAVLEARENNFLIPAGKSIWILHPSHADIVGGAGKCGLSWKCKSSKLGQQCSEGTQFIFVHRVFEQSTMLMYPCADDVEKYLTSTLPPTLGRPKPVKWDSQYLVSYVVPT